MTGRIRADDIAEVRSRVRIDEVIGEHVTLRPAGGGSLKGLCPFHDERSPSFHVTPSKGLYHCFGCQAGGDAIAFLMQVQALSFTEAVERLASRAGVQLRYEDGAGPSQRETGQRARLLAANAAAQRYFRTCFGQPGAAPARDLMAARGFDAAACEVFGVGYAPGGWDGLTKQLQREGFDQDTLLGAGLVIQGSRGGYDRFRDRITWPIRDLTSDIVGFGARRVNDAEDSPKYLNTPETLLYKKSHVLYGIDLARKAIGSTQQVVVVEGYTDVMAAHLAGITNAVATCGTAFGPDHIAVLRRLLHDDQGSRGQVIFTFDSDAAGQKAALRAFSNDQQFHTDTFVAVDPAGLDPADLRQRHGDQAIRDLVARRVPLFEFALRSATAGVDVTTAEGRTAGLRQALPILAGIRDQALRPEYARIVAGWLGLPESTVTGALKRHRSGPSSPTTPGHRAPALPGGLERDALRGLLHLPSVGGPWLDSVEPSAFDQPAYRAAYAALVDVGGPAEGEDDQEWTHRMLAGVADERLHHLLRGLAAEPMPVLSDSADDEVAAERYVVSLFARLLDRDAQRRLDALTARLAQPDAASHAVRHELQEQYRAVAALRQQLRPMITSEVGT